MTAFEQSIISDRSRLVAGAIHSLPPEGQKAVRVALEDPSAQADVVRLLLNQNAPLALATQAQSDLARVLAGQEPRVFKRMARTLAPMVQRGMDAIVEAMPYGDTPTARDARKILLTSGDPESDLARYYMALAANAVAPEYTDSIELAGVGLAGFKDTLKKIVKKIKPIAKIALPIVAGIGTSLIPGVGPILGSTVANLTGAALNGFSGGVAQGIAGSFGATGGAAGITSLIPGAAGGALVATGGGASTTGTASQVATLATSLISAFTKSKQTSTPVAQAKILPQAPASQQIVIQETAPAATAAQPATVTTVSVPAAKAPAAGIPTWAWVAGGGAVALAAVILLSDDSGRARKR